uniref:Uncharacterized protein n=1 Tax=Vitis vinifera TaxID=29760 RepID=F6HZ44_VITVI
MGEILVLKGEHFFLSPRTHAWNLRLPLPLCLSQALRAASKD